MGNSTKTRGAVIVTRVSTGEQAEHGTSLASQRDACRAKAAALAMAIVAEYEDAGVSGALLLSREGMQSALADIRDGRADTLICANLSRYSRDRLHQEQIKREVHAAGGRIVFCDLDLDLSTPEGDLFFGVAGSFAQYERMMIRQRCLKGRRQRIAEGIQTQRSSPPYGYRIVCRDDITRGEFPAEMIGKYVIIPEQAGVVQRIFSLYQDGLAGTPRIASILNRDGITTAKGGARWQASTIRSILLNPVYKGTPAYGRKRSLMDESRLIQNHPFTGKLLRTAHYCQLNGEAEWIYLSAPAIVEEAVWQAVQDRFARNQSLCGGNPRRARMLSGRVRCPLCGAPMVTVGKRAGKGSFYYTCSVSRVSAGDAANGCSGVVFEIAVTEQAVIASLEDALCRPEAIRAAIRVYSETREAPGQEDPRKRIATLDRELLSLKSREAAVVKAQIEGVIAGADTSAYLTILADIAVRRKDAEAEIGRLNRSMLEPATRREKRIAAFNTIDTERLKADLNNVLKSDNVAGIEKRDVIALVVERVVCQRGGADVYYLPGLFSSETCQNVKTRLY